MVQELYKKGVLEEVYDGIDKLYGYFKTDEGVNNGNTLVVAYNLLKENLKLASDFVKLSNDKPYMYRHGLYTALLSGYISKVSSMSEEELKEAKKYTGKSVLNLDADEMKDLITKVLGYVILNNYDEDKAYRIANDNSNKSKDTVLNAIAVSPEDKDNAMVLTVIYDTVTVLKEYTF